MLNLLSKSSRVYVADVRREPWQICLRAGWEILSLPKCVTANEQTLPEEAFWTTAKRIGARVTGLHRVAVVQHAASAWTPRLHEFKEDLRRRPVAPKFQKTRSYMLQPWSGLKSQCRVVSD